MSSRFNENTRVQVPAALHLCRLGYIYLDSIGESDCEPNTNILVNVFREAVSNLNAGITEDRINALLSELVQAAKNDDLGREFFQKITATSGERIVDFVNPNNNLWHCTVKAFRPFLNVTQLMIFSNNQEYDSENVVPVQGAFYATIARDRAFFNVFREKYPDEVLRDSGYRSEIDDEVQKRILKHRNCIPIKEDPEYQTNKSPTTPTNRIITSMLSHRRFLFILRYAFAYVEKTRELVDGSRAESLEKHVMRYQQLFATFALRKKLSDGVKGGVIWHTQGSGKTAFAYYNVKCLTDFYAERNTVAKFFFIVDRLDLLEQSADEFAARGLMVQKVQSRAELMDKVKDNQARYNPLGRPEIIVVNIQKFKEDHTPVVIDGGYSTNLQRVFFIDEAHRGYNPAGSFLANLLEADKDSVKIAMTGTPLLAAERASWRVFGDWASPIHSPTLT